MTADNWTSMGNAETHDFAPVRGDERRELNLSRKVNHKQYARVKDFYYKFNYVNFVFFQ